MFGPERGRGGNIGKTDEELIKDLISIHNAENWLGIDGDSDLFKPLLNIDDDEKGNYYTFLASELMIIIFPKLYFLLEVMRLVVEISEFKLEQVLITYFYFVFNHESQTSKFPKVPFN